MKRNGQYWTEEDVREAASAGSFSELAQIALRVVSRMPDPVSQVCGPISTGGLGNIETNLRVFDATIDQLMDQGIVVFDQMPFEEHFFRIMENDQGSRQNDQLLKEFYAPLFESGKIKRLYFIHDWESSHGARWEHERAQEYGIGIEYLPYLAHLPEGDRNVMESGC